MIDFRVNTKSLAKFKYFMWHAKGMYLLHLEAIDIRSKDGMVYPYYKPLFFIETHPGQWIFNLNIGMKVYSVIFQKTDPYIAFEVADLAVKEEKDED